MNQLGPWAVLQAIDLLLGKSSQDTPDEAFAWGRPQRFSVGRIVEDQQRSLRGHHDVITVERTPSRKGMPETNQCT